MKTVTTTSIPASLPSQERAEILRDIYSKHVRHGGGHWKGPCCAIVDPWMADDVAEAMDFMGSIVDARVVHTAADGLEVVVLFSRGYWAHGF